MNEFYCLDDDYNIIFKSPEEAVEMMEMNEGDSFSLLKICVFSRNTFLIKNGDILHVAVSIPTGEIE